MPLIRRLLPTAMLALGCFGCASDKPQFAVRYASGAPPSSGPVSVFGVFDNGRLSPEAWREIGPQISSSLGGRLCESAWNDQFVSANPALASAIDDYTKDESVTERLLASIAPMAKGKSILSFVVLSHRAGERSPEEKAAAGPPSPAQSRGGGIGRGGMRGTGWAQPSLSDYRGAQPNEVTYEIAALLYSIDQRRTVALISMTYEGPNLALAMQQYSAKLRGAFPNLSCSGWDFEAPVDAAAIRSLIKPVRAADPDVD